MEAPYTPRLLRQALGSNATLTDLDVRENSGAFVADAMANFDAWARMTDLQDEVRARAGGGRLSRAAPVLRRVETRAGERPVLLLCGSLELGRAPLGFRPPKTGRPSRTDLFST